MNAESDPPPATLDAVLGGIWELLEDGASNRHSPFHTPTLATVEDGAPRARTVVLRAAVRGENRLRFNTDVRAPKHAQMAAAPQIALHVYDPDRKTQVRITGMVTLSRNDDRSRDVWDAMRAMSRECYRQGCAPGTPVETPVDVPRDTLKDAEGLANFAVADMTVETIDWLYLRHDGHMRAGFDVVTGTAEWRAP